MSTAANPRHPDNPPSDPPQESTGPVAKDSLAAESINAGGAFADNDNAAVSSVKGSQSTFATTDHSNAETLKPAASGAERDNSSDSTTQYPDAEAGSQNYSGTHSLDGGYVGGPSNSSAAETSSSSATENFGSDKPAPDPNKISSSGVSHTTSESHPAPDAGTGSRPKVETAPNYTLDPSADSKPKGKNLVEGGDVPENVGTHTGAVTGPNDPGRLAEQNYTKFETAGAGKQDYGESQKQGEGLYDVLDNHERA